MRKLTNAQKSIWVTEQYYKGSPVNSICGYAMIGDKVDFNKLEQAIQIVCKKHDNFWLRLKIENGEVKQTLAEKQDVKLITIEVEDLKEMEKEAKKIVNTLFKIENSELFQIYIFKFKNGQGAFMPNVHHLISDGWTFALISNEVIKAYSALIQNKEVETKAIYSYLDYIKSEQEYMESEKFQKDKVYWEEKFATIPEVATIPGSKANGDLNNPKGNRKKYKLDEQEVAKIKQYCKENKISIYNFLMAIYGIYIGEISNLDEFVIGTPILNRTNFKEKSAMGMFVNMAPLKIDMTKANDFKTFVKNIALDSIGMLKHQKYSYQCLLENLREKNKTMPNLYNILLSYQITNAHQSDELVKYKTDWIFNGCCAENMDIQISDFNDTGSLDISYDYKTSIYEDEDIEKLHKRIIHIIDQVIEKQDIELKDVEIVTPEEKEKLLIEFNKTELKYNPNIPIIKYFEEQVLKTPNNTAIVFKNKEMTYKELNEKANSLAYELRKNGVTNNTIVGIMQERSFEMIIAILAVLKAGGGYIPIATDYPADRIQYMLEDSNASILLAETNEIKTDKKVLSIKLDNKLYESNKEKLENISKPEDLSYLIYTSGSTGTPKGVMLKQKNLTNFYHAMLQNIEYLTAKEPIKIISLTTLSFDIFIFETLMSLTRGLTLYMTNENEQKVTEKLENKIKENGIQAIQTTPSIMKFHLDNIKNRENLKSLKYIILAGEPLPKTLVENIKQLIPGVKVYNGYGPSETTIFSTTRDVTDLKEVTIGRPIANTQIYILNKNKKILPQGCIGEMYIAGDGVGKGYMNKKEQTESSFTKNPFLENSIMYKSGDLGSFDENGEITCYGRVDNQIKIRGLRVELPEIERQMLSIDNIQNVVVVKKEINGRAVLCAYHTESGRVDLNDIKELLQNKLPQYMIPQYFVKLDKMPYTPNGKIDKKLLPMPDLQEKAKEKVEIKNEIDKELVQIIQKMMHIENINLSDTLLDLGGDSLTAITLVTKISSKFNVQIDIKNIISNKTIQEISDIIKENQSKGFEKIKIEKAPKQETYPLSSAQKRIYYNSQMIGEENLVYNTTGGIIVDEILEHEKLEKAFNKIIERHSSLRTSFILKDTEVVQKICENVQIKIPVYHNTEKEVQDIIQNFAKPFKLDEDLLLRVELHYIDNKKTLLLVDSHHIIMDGTALNNLIKEFEKLYNGENLKELKLQYIDYAVWENKFNESEEIKRYEEYWVNKFKEAELSQLNLPYDYKSSANRSYKGNKISNIIDEKQFRKIENYAKKLGVSPYVLFISAFFILLYKYTGQEEITLGSPISNRDINETEKMIGMFVNNIVVKANIKSEESFQEFVNGIKEQILDDVTNQPYPFDMLVKKLGIKADNSRNPLFDVMFTYQNQESEALKLGEHEVDIIEIDNNISKFDLSLEVKPKSHIINIEYCTDLFKKHTVERFFEHYMNVLDGIISDNDVKISDISIISEEEKNKILYEFNDTKMEYPRNKTVVQLFEEQVEKTPNKIAVVFKDKKLTYKELNEKANQLANTIKKQNVNSEDVIAILLDKSLEMIIAILAILKNGCTYLPIDIGYPKDRKEYILKDSNAKLLLTSRELNLEADLLVKTIYIDIDTENIYLAEETKNIEYQGKASDLAYIMYTSGSTGKPKGVMIENRSIVRLVKNTNYIEFKENDKILQTGSIVFDACTLEIWGALLNGLELYIIEKEELLDASLLHTYILKNKISVLWLTAPLFNQLCEENPHMFRTVRCVLSGGDVLSCKHINMVRTANPNLIIINGYGPTENTTFSCCHHIEKEYKQSIPIGKPIANSTGYIVSKDGNLQPIGIPGELWVGGDGVARGYVNNSDLTKEKFIDNPFGSGKIYKTGDLTKWNKDGTVDFMGRIDSQIKIRGFRVEVSEITTVVAHFNGIKEAYTVCKEIQKEKAICTYIVAKTEIDITELKEFLNKFLPQYMVPKYIVQLKKLPKNQNGKVDKNALPEILINEADREIILPSNDLEEKISNIFKEILGLNEISVNDNFFEYGGDSINAMRLQLALLKNNLDIKYGDIFKYHTVKELALNVKEIKNVEKIKKYPTAEYYPISSAQKRMYLSSNMDPNSKLYNITGGILMDSCPDIEKLQKSLNTIVDRQDSLRTYFERMGNGKIIQKIKDKLDVKINIFNSTTNNVDEILNKYQSMFDLSKAPLFKVFLFKLPNKKVLFMLDIHHIIFDGTSLNIFLQELSDLYNGLELEEQYISYKDFSIWEKEQLNNSGFEKSKSFWIKQFKTDIPILNMPTTYSRPVNINYNGDTYLKIIPTELTKKIEKLAKENDVTPYMIMLSAYYILLYKYTGQEDIIVGTPISGRIYNELKSILGVFVNSLPLRKQISSNTKFKTFLEEIKDYCINCFENQDYPFDLLVNDLNIQKDNTRNPLFDTMFIYLNNGFTDIKFDEIKTEQCLPKSNTSKFDISLEVIPIKDEMNLTFEYKTQLFDSKFIERFANHYCNILECITNNVEDNIENIVILDKEEKNKILYEFNDNKLPYDKEKSIIQLFEEQVIKTPNNVALIFEEHKLTFEELNKKANQLAEYLVENGIGPNCTVGIMVTRSIEIMIAIIAVLKTGACYIPIDPTLPEKRINYMLNNSDVSTILTNCSTSKEINAKNIIDIKIDNVETYTGKGENLSKNINPEWPSYMIYTSGSTGIPKGVVLNHKALSNLANYLNKTVEFLKDEYANIPMCSITTISFDIFIFETLICLQRGLKIIIASEEQQNTPNLLDELIEKHNIKAIQMTPSRMYIFVNNKEIMPHLNNLDYIVLAGEALPKDLLNQILDINCKARVYNGYGPSETTVFATFTDVTKYENITIGKPISNTRIYILDKDKNICPIGIPGELYIAGDGVGIGYCNNQEITSERFIKDVFYDNEKMYKSGDLAKYLPNGEIHYIGRIDNQIKIRGLRIELDEIEKCILKYPNIDKCIISSNVDNNNRQFIVAYLTINDRISINKLKAFLKTMLPKYMIPSYFIVLDKIPYLNNGKIDKKSLPKPKMSMEAEKDINYVAPKTKIQVDVANIFQNLLTISPIGMDDNFFELGGDSLLAINLQVELLKNGYNITYSDIFMNPSVRDLENLILENKNAKLDDINSKEFTEFDDILKNNCNIIKELNYVEMKNIILTGATGFLGVHVLAEFLEKEDGKAYCIIRSEPGLNVRDKLLKKLHFYFRDVYDKLIDDRIIIVNADIIEENLGLNDSEIEKLFKNISCVINCAAKVSHYGNYNDYKLVNVLGTENLLKLCLKFKKKFYQISTLSISGNHLVNMEDEKQKTQTYYNFKESDFFINQSLENVYVKSKFEAEKLVFKYILMGLEGYIFRVGNLMNRLSDGKFQPNVDENAAVNRIISITNIGCIPDYIKNIDIEFTPVDSCAKAIIKLIQYPSTNNKIFHLYDHNYTKIENFISTLKNYTNIEMVTEDEFSKRIDEMLERKDANRLLAGILRDLDSNRKILQESKIKMNCEFTTKYLSKIGFTWPEINDIYLKLFLDYFVDNGYINKREEKI